VAEETSPVGVAVEDCSEVVEAVSSPVGVADETSSVGVEDETSPVGVAEETSPVGVAEDCSEVVEAVSSPVGVASVVADADSSEEEVDSIMVVVIEPSPVKVGVAIEEVTDSSVRDDSIVKEEDSLET
jgi:hypothetical protein